MLKYLLDTNIAIYVIKQRPIEALETFNKYAGLMAISTITEAELIHSAEKSQLREHNLNQIADFISRLEVLPYKRKAAAHYGDIRANLEKKGTPIGVNDLHIAAHARSEGLLGRGFAWLDTGTYESLLEAEKLNKNTYGQYLTTLVK